MRENPVAGIDSMGLNARKSIIMREYFSLFFPILATS
jgi:hypothetical protein